MSTPIPNNNVNGIVVANVNVNVHVTATVTDNGTANLNVNMFCKSHVKLTVIVKVDGNANINDKNGVDDDIYFSVGENDKRAYYSRYDGNGFGGSDIYEVHLLYKENYLTPVKFMVKDPQTKEPIEAMIRLYVEETGEMYGDYLPNEKGEFLFIVKPEMKFNMEISADGFATNNAEFHITTDDVSDDLLFREIIISN